MEAYIKANGRKGLYVKMIGILTFHDTVNFGATLQAMATYKALEGLGVKSEIINYHCRQIDVKELPRYIITREKNKVKAMLFFLLKGYKYSRKHRKLYDFLCAETSVSKEKYDKNNIELTNGIYDKFLVGSDMLWCTKFTKEDRTFFLDFIDDKNRKFAFATSVGYRWDDSEIEIIKAYLSDFCQIAVRETDIAEQVRNIIGKEVRTVCDPTMLVEPSIWKNYTKRNKEKYYLVYMDDGNQSGVCAAMELARNNDIKVKQVEFSVVGRKRNGYEVIECYSISEFLSAIENAKMLFTASYHGMLFAIYFHVPFVYYNKDSSRLEGIALRFGLAGRNGEKYKVSEMEEINWAEVDRIREKYVEESLEVLKGMLVS